MYTDRYNYNILNLLYHKIFNKCVDQMGYITFIDMLQKDNGPQMIVRISSILTEAKLKNIPPYKLLDVPDKKLQIKLNSEFIKQNPTTFRLQNSIKHLLDLSSIDDSRAQVFDVEKTRLCGKYSFNGSIILWDNNKEIWCNKAEKIENCFVFNISRSCENHQENLSSIKYKIINLQGDILTISKNIWDKGPREDPKIFLANGNIFISYSYLYFYPGNKIKAIKIKYCQLNNFKPLEEIHLDFGNNSLDKMHNKLYYEKNWLFGEFNGLSYIIYSLCPLIVYDSEKKTKIVNLDWIHRYTATFHYKFNIRAGASPVIIDDKLWIWGHTNENIPDSEYYPILVVLDHEFGLYAYTNPIIVVNNVRVIYPAGAIFLEDSQKWVLSCGFQDQKQILVHIKHQTILENLIFYN